MKRVVDLDKLLEQLEKHRLTTAGVAERQEPDGKLEFFYDGQALGLRLAMAIALGLPRMEIELKKDKE